MHTPVLDSLIVELKYLNEGLELLRQANKLLGMGTSGPPVQFIRPTRPHIDGEEMGRFLLSEVLYLKSVDRQLKHLVNQYPASYSPDWAVCIPVVQKYLDRA
jgi:hypothetical protein